MQSNDGVLLECITSTILAYLSEEYLINKKKPQTLTQSNVKEQLLLSGSLDEIKSNSWWIRKRFFFFCFWCSKINMKGNIDFSKPLALYFELNREPRYRYDKKSNAFESNFWKWDVSTKFIDPWHDVQIDGGTFDSPVRVFLDIYHQIGRLLLSPLSVWSASSHAPLCSPFFLFISNFHWCLSRSLTPILSGRVHLYSYLNFSESLFMFLFLFLSIQNTGNEGVKRQLPVNYRQKMRKKTETFGGRRLPWSVYIIKKKTNYKKQPAK